MICQSNGSRRGLWIPLYTSNLIIIWPTHIWQRTKGAIPHNFPYNAMAPNPFQSCLAQAGHCSLGRSCNLANVYLSHVSWGRLFIRRPKLMKKIHLPVDGFFFIYQKIKFFHLPVDESFSSIFLRLHFFSYQYIKILHQLFVDEFFLSTFFQ